jgi:protein ImuA
MPPPGVRERIVLLRRRIAAIEARDGPLRRASGEANALNHAAFEQNRSNAENVIDSRELERASSEKPVPTFASRALASSAQEFFEALPGAFAQGGLSEIVPARPRDAAAAAGFASVLALCAVVPRGASAVWIAEDMAAQEIGLPYAKGLEALGLDPARLVVARTRDSRETLWTMEEALKRRVGAVVAESWIAPGAYGLAASRRLSLAAQRGGGLGLLLLLRAANQGGRLASAARLRFEIAAPSPPRATPGCGPPLPGPLGWRLRLLKARLDAACPGGLDAPEWREILFDPDRGALRHAFPQRLPAETCDRPDLAAARRALA